MCYLSGMLYSTERRWEAGSARYRLAVNSVSDWDTLALLDTLDLHLQDAYRQPRVDRQTGRIYIPCMSRGVRVVRYDGIKLIPVTTLRCVWEAASLAVVSSDTLYVSDWDIDTVSVCLVDVLQDKVITRLQAPKEVSDRRAGHIAVLADTVLVDYGGKNLVTYRHGVPTRGKMLPQPQGLRSVTALTTDHHSSFLLTDVVSRSVYVLDISGNLTYTIPLPGNRWPLDCTVVGRQLWVGCRNGDITVMSSQ